MPERDLLGLPGFVGLPGLCGLGFFSFFSFFSVFSAVAGFSSFFSAVADILVSEPAQCGNVQFKAPRCVMRPTVRFKRCRGHHVTVCTAHGVLNCSSPFQAFGAAISRKGHWKLEPVSLSFTLCLNISHGIMLTASGVTFHPLFLLQFSQDILIFSAIITAKVVVFVSN